MRAASTRTVRPVPPPDAEINAIAADIAHQLANLVQVVSGNLELVAARSTDPKVLRYLDNARAAALQLTELTRRLRGEDR